MNNPIFRRVFLFVFLLSFHFVFSQLVNSEVQLWEKSVPTSRESLKCKDENLLNFHCGIKDKLIKKYIKYSKNMSHTLTVVHKSKEDELIWQNTDKGISLANDRYKKGESNNIEIRKRPSIFSFTSVSDPKKGKSDSLRIKFEDQNLYEMIFIPKRAKPLDLNKIHSYLSIKYGISLEKGKYYSSDGQVIWDPEKHKEFKYRPTGLGRDDGNELYQKQSTNQADQILAIGINDIKRTNVDNTIILDNNTFAIWSDDNKELATEIDGNFTVLKRNWEISFIGKSIPKSDYKIRIDKSIINPKSLNVSYWLFLKDSDGKITKVPGTASDNFITFSKVDFKKNSGSNQDVFHFTFAVSPLKDPKDSNSLLNITHNQNDLSLDLEKIILYPNPVKAGHDFTLKFPPMEDLVVSIYDGAGRLIAMDKVDRNSNHYVNHLPTQSAYLINLTQNGKIIKTFKLIVE